MTPQVMDLETVDTRDDPFADLDVAQLGELEVADAVALPEMGASSGSFGCCSSSSTCSS